MKIGQIAIAAAMMAVSCCVANAALRVQYKGFTPTASVNVAVEDLREMAGRADAEGLDGCVFELDKRVGGGEFGYELQNGSVTFRGGDEASVAHACYTFMEDMGYTFDFTGTTAPQELTPLSRIHRRTVKPKVRWRGIRQHVNFPMDISSYDIDEAKAYLR
ncbi:MAG: hypothetical protein ACI4UL_08735, partial [Muribaculaceae bacterium]